MATKPNSTNSPSPQPKQFFIYAPHEDGRPIVEDGKAVAYVEASAQDVREKLEQLALYLKDSLRLKGSPKARRLADEALDLLARTINPNYKDGAAA